MTADVGDDSNSAGYCTEADERQENYFVHCLELMGIFILRGYFTNYDL